MSNRIPRRRKIGSFKHKKGNTPYKWYNPDKRECKLQPADQAHLDSIGPKKSWFWDFYGDDACA